MFVYNGVFNGTPKDDGSNNFEISLALFGYFKDNVDFLNLEKDHDVTAAAVLLDTILQIRAFCYQRRDKLQLSKIQVVQEQAIANVLADTKLSYQKNERQALVDRCEKDPALVEKMKAFAKTWDQKWKEAYLDKYLLIKDASASNQNQ